MTVTNLGILSWSVSQDNEAHRNYDIDWLLHTTDVADGPYTIGTSGTIPYPGDIWIYGNDYDPWAICQPEMTLKPNLDKEPNQFWTVSQKFSTKAGKRDQTTPPGNPLLEPPDVSGSFVKYTKEATEDRDGNAILSTSFERFKGAAVERDANRHSVTIKMNIPTLPMDDWLEYIDTVNDDVMWGLAAGTIKLSEISWARKYYSSNMASIYYTVTYGFDINYETFTRKILDEGTKVLRPGGTVSNPSHYISNNGPVLLTSGGVAITADSGANGPNYLEFELYPEKDLFVLGIPTVL